MSLGHSELKGPGPLTALWSIQAIARTRPWRPHINNPYYHPLHHFSVILWIAWFLKSFCIDCVNQCSCCWCPGTCWCQGISRNSTDADLVVIYSVAIIRDITHVKPLVQLCIVLHAAKQWSAARCYRTCCRAPCQLGLIITMSNIAQYHTQHNGNKGCPAFELTKDSSIFISHPCSWNLGRI